MRLRLVEHDDVLSAGLAEALGREVSVLTLWARRSRRRAPCPGHRPGARPEHLCHRVCRMPQREGGQEQEGANAVRHCRLQGRARGKVKYDGLASSAERADLLAYLATLN